MLRAFRNFALLLCLFVPLASAWAGEVLDRISKTGTLRVGMTGTQPPFSMKTRDGEFIGMDVDLSRMLAESMGVRLELVELEFAALLPALETGKVDMVLSGVTATFERNMRVAFVAPYYISGKSMLTKSSVIAGMSEYDELNAKAIRIATLAGSTGEAFVKRMIPNAGLVTVRDYEEGVRRLNEGQVEALLADAPIIQLTAMRHPDQGFVQMSSPLTVEPIGVALPPDDALLLNLVENYMNAVEVTGRLDTLQDKWFKDDAWLTQIP